MQTEIPRVVDAGSDYYNTFKPRPDQPDKYDEQTAFVDSKDKGFSILVGGNACIGRESRIYDPVAREYVTIGERREPFHVYALHPDGTVGISEASAPFVKGSDSLYEIALASGEKFVATLDHRVLTPSGEWRAIRQLRRGERLLSRQPGFSSETPKSEPAALPCEPNLGPWSEVQPFSGQTAWPRGAKTSKGGRATTHVSFLQRRRQPISCQPFDRAGASLSWSCLCVPTGRGIAPNSQCGCRQCRRSCGGRLREAQDTDQVSFPLATYVPGRIRRCSYTGGRRTSQECSRPCLQGDHQTNSRYAHAWHQSCEVSRRSASLPYLPSFALGDTLDQDCLSSIVGIHRTPTGRKFPAKYTRYDTILPFPQAAKDTVSTALSGPPCDSANQSTYITTTRFLRQDLFYDIQVFPYHNYLMDGVFHHNSGTSSAACCKLARFVLREQEPPRRDTPFWIVGGTYPQIINSVWKEKLSPRSGHGHIPESEIDWGRISYYNAKLALPLSVPLKPWPGKPGKNWLLEFKSYEQGRAEMQARSIGGVMLSEQFPFEILLEILRGCRESGTNYPGSKFAEYTPIDPVLSIEIEDMIEQDKLPGGWKIYRCNTQCAMEAGHVDEDWFYEFFGSVSDEMKDTRMIGARASYEGIIFQSFNPAVHCKPIGQKHPRGVKYYRGIDWGASSEHPFVCIWAYVDSVGAYHVFDEYWNNHQHILLSDHVKAIKEKFKWDLNSPNFGPTFADPSRPDLFTEFARMKVPCVPANNSIYSGIECIRQHLQINESLKQPRLFIDRERCPILTRQLRTYRWLKSKTTGLNPKSARPEPLKREEDTVDALRYLMLSSYRSGTMAPSFQLPAGAQKPRKSVGINRFNRGRIGGGTSRKDWNKSKRDGQ